MVRLLGRETLVDGLVRELAGGIFRGEVEAGSKLLPMRKLAQEYGVTVATAQRAVARLEALGLVETRQGSGMQVKALEEVGGISLLPMWMEACLSQEEKVVGMLEDFLELRRVLALALLEKLHGRWKELEVETLEGLVLRFKQSKGPKQAMERDLEVVRMLLSWGAQSAFRAVFNVLEQLLQKLPTLQEAMYTSAAENAAAYEAVFAAMGQVESFSDLREMVTAAIAETDRATTERFRAGLQEKTKR